MGVGHRDGPRNGCPKERKRCSSRREDAEAHDGEERRGEERRVQRYLNKPTVSSNPSYI
jgi:hypothetical protein